MTGEVKQPNVKDAAGVIRALDEHNVGYIRLFFVDVLGHLKGMSITRSEIDAVLESGQGFDGSSIEGYVRIEESDLMAIPDPTTLRIIPWDVNGQKIALIFCDIQTPDGKPYEGDPRQVLRRATQRASERGLTFNCGPEMEYFYFRDSNGTEFLDRDGYFDYSTVDEGTKLRKKAVVALEKLGIQVECSHHEVAPSSHEIDLKYQNALRMADFAMLYRFVVKELALQDGAYASFMPKPVFGINGSGMHVHMSLFKEGKNLFFDGNDPDYLSREARRFTAGILDWVREMTLVTNQWVNSYKRLVVGYEAPVYISWGRKNRSSLIRVPMYRAGKEKATRIELRSPDPACNPYLAFACMLSAGLDGIDRQLDLPDPFEKNVFAMTPNERKNLGIQSLPGSLEEAISITAGSTRMREVLGEHVFETLLANKRLEWDRYRTQVTDFELAQYLHIL